MVKQVLIQNNKLRISVIGQQLRAIAPYAVDTFYSRLNNPADTSEQAVPLISVSTQPLLYAAINAIKELDSVNNVLMTRVSQLENLVANCCSNAPASININNNSGKATENTNGKLLNEQRAGNITVDK